MIAVWEQRVSHGEMGLPPQSARRGAAGLQNDRVDSPRILLVDDDGFTRTTLSGALAHEGFEIVDAVPDAQGAIGRATALLPNCAVIDLDLGLGPTGIDLAHGLRRALPQLGIVILTSFTDPRLLSSSLKDLPLGATYVVKQSLSDMAMLAEAIEAAIAMAGSGVDATAASGLTNAQVETLRLLACGLSNADIARIRVVTEKSVEQTIARTAKRLCVDVNAGNQRVLLAREYFRLTGATRHARTNR